MIVMTVMSSQAWSDRVYSFQMRVTFHYRHLLVRLKTLINCPLFPKLKAMAATGSRKYAMLTEQLAKSLHITDLECLLDSHSNSESFVDD